MALVVALLAAVAGGNLAVTAAPTRPYVGRRVEVRVTGQVGDTGRLYVYRTRRAHCADTARGAAATGRRLATRAVDGSFDFTTRYTARKVGREWVCGYLYAMTCDPAGLNCGAATGLPPDAGFSRVRIRVRPRS